MMIIIPEMITTRHTGLDQHKPNKATESYNERPSGDAHG
jgi:hypothetical protein